MERVKIFTTDEINTETNTEQFSIVATLVSVGNPRRYQSLLADPLITRIHPVLCNHIDVKDIPRTLFPTVGIS